MLGWVRCFARFGPTLLAVVEVLGNIVRSLAGIFLLRVVSGTAGPLRQVALYEIQLMPDVVPAVVDVSHGVVAG